MHGFSTKAIHAGQEPDPTTGAVITPDPPVLHVRAGRRRRHPRRATSTRAAPTPPAPRCRSASPRWRAGGTRVAFGSGLAAADALLRVLLRPGDHIVIPHDAYGGTFRLVDKVLGPWGVEHTPGRPRRRRRAAGGAAPRDPGDLVRDADQPAAGHRRHRRGGRRRPRGAGPARRRQHVRLAVPAAAARAGRRRRGALHDEVPRRPLRRRRRRAGHLRRRARRAAALHPERGGRGARPVRRVAHAARRQDPRRAHGAAQRQRRAGGRVPRRAPRGRAGALPGPARAPGPRGRGQADAPLRRHGLLPAGAAAARRRCGSARPPRCSRSPSRSAASSR